MSGGIMRIGAALTALNLLLVLIPLSERAAASTLAVPVPQSTNASGASSDAESTGPVTDASSPVAALQEVVVTAQRRRQTMDKVPISMTALSQDSLDTLHIQSFSDLASVVPGLLIPHPENTTATAYSIAIRGIFDYAANAPTTALYIDDTPISTRYLANAPSGPPEPEIFDLQRVEVLRGPQGTLFGASAMGGAIRWITPEPNLYSPSGYSKAEFGYTENGAPSYAAGVAYGAPIVPGVVGYRVSAYYHDDGGFVNIEDPYTGQTVGRNVNQSRSYVVHSAMSFVPTDDLKITPALYVQYHHADAPDDYWATDLPQTDSDKPASGALIPQPQTDQLLVASLAITNDLKWATFDSNTSYLDHSFNFSIDYTEFFEGIFTGQELIPGLSPSFAVRGTQPGGTIALQQEFRLASPDTDARVQWLVGAFYRRSVARLTQPVYGDLSPMTEACCGVSSLQYFGGVPNYVINGQALNSFTSFTTADEATAGYGQLSARLIGGLKASVGVRVEHSVVAQQHEVVAGPINGIGYLNRLLPDQVANPVTPSFGLTYQLNDRDMVYTTVSKGYRPGGANSPLSAGNAVCNPSAEALGLTSVPETYNSDSVWSYEVGTKDRSSDGRLALEASAYHIDWLGIQTSVFLPSCGESFIRNGGRAVSQGFDLQLAALPMKGVRLSANVGYTDAYYPNASYGPAVSGPAPLLIGAGDKLSEAIPWTVSVQAEYSHEIDTLWSGANGYVRADYRWLDGAPKGDPRVANYDPEIGPYPDQAYDMIDLRLGVTRGGLDLSAFVNNVTNSDPRLSYVHWGPHTPIFFADALRPRTVGITALYHF
jgi:iron complex outermembrane recepter protein